MWVVVFTNGSWIGVLVQVLISGKKVLLLLCILLPRPYLMAITIRQWQLLWSWRRYCSDNTNLISITIRLCLWQRLCSPVECHLWWYWLPKMWVWLQQVELLIGGAASDERVLVVSSFLCSSTLLTHFAHCVWVCELHTLLKHFALFTHSAQTLCSGGMGIELVAVPVQITFLGMSQPNWIGQLKIRKLQVKRQGNIWATTLTIYIMLPCQLVWSQAHTLQVSRSPGAKLYLSWQWRAKSTTQPKSAFPEISVILRKILEVHIDTRPPLSNNNICCYQSAILVTLIKEWTQHFLTWQGCI